MATVPTADVLGLGKTIKTSPDRTPVEGPSSELAFAAQKISAGQQKAVSGEIMKLTTTVNEAMVAAKAKEDTINRAIEFNSYFKEMSGEFQKLKSGDLSSTTALEAFNTNLRTRTEGFLGDHQGTDSSREKFAVRLENQRALFSAGAESAIETAQQDVIDGLYGDDIAKIVAKVATGEIDMSEALIAVDGVAAEHSDATSVTDMLNKTETAQQLVILGTLQRFVDLGQTDKAEAIINSNPEVLQTLDPKAVGKLIRGMELQKIAKANLIAKKAADRTAILQGAGVSDPSKLTPSMRMLYYTGKLGPKPGADGRTKEQKNADALTLLETKHGGRDTPAYRNLAALVLKQAAEKKTPLQLQFERLDKLEKAGGDDNAKEIRILREQINKEDPEFIAKKKKEEDFPVAQDSIIILRTETEMLLGKIDEALILATNAPKDDINKALILAKKGEGGYWETGNVGMALAFLSGSSEAAELEESLTPIRSNTVLNVMDKMRAQSSSGATGLGAMSEPERVMLRDSEGSLNARVPGQLLRTLLRMRKELPKILARQEKKYKDGFASILGIDPEIQEVDATEEPDRPRDDGKKPNSTTGAPVIRLNKFENPDG